MYDDPDSDFWRDHTVIGGRTTKHDNKLVVKKVGLDFTLKYGVFKMITDNKSNTEGSPDTKLTSDFSDKMLFHTRTRFKSVGDQIFFKKLLP